MLENLLNAKAFQDLFFEYSGALLELEALGQYSKDNVTYVRMPLYTIGYAADGMYHT